MKPGSSAIAFALAACLVTPVAARAQTPIDVRLGTVAPPRSPWYRMLEDVKQEWARISGGRVRVRILNTVGDERTLIQKMRVGALQAVAVSGAGLPELDRGISALHTPLLFDTYDELDYVRDHLAPRLEADLAARGVVVLHWSDVGWVYFFSKTPMTTPAELRRLRLFTTAGDADTEALLKASGYKPQPLPSTELLSGLQTGLIDAFDVPPLFALLNQSFALAPHMTDLRWAVLTGATVIDRRTWDRIPQDLRAPLLDAARQAAARYRAQIRKMGDDAVVEMQRQHLEVHAVDAASLHAWQTETQAAYPKIRGTLAPEDLFDETLRLRAEYRRRSTVR